MRDAQSYRPPPPKEKAPGAVELLDEAFHRLRAAPPGVLGLYYAGTLPFVLALLYFWGDLSHNADAAHHGTGAALGLALVFLWMKTCQALFARRLRDLFALRSFVWPSLASLTNLFIVQSFVHSVGAFLLLGAALITVPFGWVYAFFQSATAIGAGDEGTLFEVSRRSWKAAILWPKQNHMMLLVLSLLGLFVWIDVAAMVFGLPQLLKLATGEENVMTRGGISFFNSTFIGVTLSLAFLVLDPVVKTFYALRCFYAESQLSGEDLKSELRELPPARTAAVPRSVVTAAMLLIAGLSFTFSAGAQATLAPEVLPPTSIEPALPPLVDGDGTIRPPALDQSIQEVLRRREFAWRLPPPPPTEDATPKMGWLDNIHAWLHDTGKWVLGQVGDAFATVHRWWRKLFPEKKEDPASANVSSHGLAGLLPVLRLVMYGLGIVLAVALLYFAWKSWERRPTAELVGRDAGAGTAADPDLTDDEVVASLLPEDEWLQLSRRHLAAGETRLALRALYLSVLALLGSCELLVIARSKSNRDYQSELRRRARDRTELQAAFHRNVGRYERVWYGPHPATPELFDQFMTDRQLISDAVGHPLGSPVPAA